MKTAISVPDELFREVEDLVRRSGRPRSEIYSAALREYVARHDPDAVTEALDAVLRDLGDAVSGDLRFVDAAAREALATSQW